MESVSRPTSVRLMLLKRILSSALPPCTTAVTQVVPGKMIKVGLFLFFPSLRSHLQTERFETESFRRLLKEELFQRGQQIFMSHEDRVKAEELSSGNWSCCCDVKDVSPRLRGETSSLKETALQRRITIFPSFTTLHLSSYLFKTSQ